MSLISVSENITILPKKIQSKNKLGFQSFLGLFPNWFWLEDPISRFCDAEDVPERYVMLGTLWVEEDAALFCLKKKVYQNCVIREKTMKFTTSEHKGTFTLKFSTDWWFKVPSIERKSSELPADFTQRTQLLFISLLKTLTAVRYSSS